MARAVPGAVRLGAAQHNAGNPRSAEEVRKGLERWLYELEAKARTGYGVPYSGPELPRGGVPVDDKQGKTTGRQWTEQKSRMALEYWRSQHWPLSSWVVELVRCTRAL